MTNRTDIKTACQHCGCAVEAGEAECRRYSYWMMMAYVYAEAMRLRLDEPMTHNTRNTQ